MHYTTAAEAVKLIRSNDSVYIQGSTSIPEALVAAMAERGGELEHVTVYSAFAVGAFDAPYCRPEYKESFLVNSLFVANNIRRWLADGYGQTIPAFLGEIPALFRDGTLPLDVALINVSPPDAEGYCSFGVSADLAVSAVECAKTIIAQVNRAMPYSYGDAVIHVSRLAAAVEVDSPLVEVPTAVPSETERKIGSYIAELIPDGATLQIGVGGIPNAVLAALGGHRHLGLHTEAMTDGVLPLLESGVIDNSQKAVMPGVTVASLALGSRRLYDYMDYRKDLVMKDVAWTNDPFRIRQNPKVMAINSAVEVDLTGQVCADSVGMRIISGVGGQHDFMYGGALSEGGKTFIAEKFAEETGFNYTVVKSSDLASIYIHGSQQMIGKLFDEARAKAPTVLCFDEFDALVPSRKESTHASMAGEVNEFLSQLNNCGKKGGFVIATSNRPDMIDPAVLRTGRIDRMIYVPVPDKDARRVLFEINLKDRPTEDVDCAALAERTVNFVASDIAYAVNDAAITAAFANVPISQKILCETLDCMRPSVTEEMLAEYDKLRDKMTGMERRAARTPIGFKRQTH